MGAPHLLQNRVPCVMAVPHLLQNAICYLAVGFILTREYIADGGATGPKGPAPFHALTRPLKGRSSTVLAGHKISASAFASRAS